MITLPELLEDARYKKYFCTPPKMLIIPGQKPWQIKVQLEQGGSWRKKEFATYVEAFNAIRPYLKDGRLYDGAIRSRSIAFGPPERIAKIVKNGRPVYHTRNGKRVLDNEGRPIQLTKVVLWRPKLDASEETHIWCTYCRRPTVFQWFTSHHALRTSGLHGMVDPSDRRCTICGAREDYIRTTANTARRPSFDPRSHLVASNRRTRR